MIPLPTLDALDSITIPVACPVSWDTMRGDHRTRFCDSCNQNVHDVSELTRSEAIQLVGGVLGSKTPVHPNDHVNMGHSSNDAFPTAMHIATLMEIETRVLPPVRALVAAVDDRSPFKK